MCYFVQQKHFTNKLRFQPDISFHVFYAAPSVRYPESTCWDRKGWLGPGWTGWNWVELVGPGGVKGWLDGTEWQIWRWEGQVGLDLIE